MKRIIALVSVALCFVLVLSACSTNSYIDKTTKVSSTTSTTTTTTTTTTTATTKPESSNIYYPTVEEYMEAFDDKYAQYISYSKTDNVSANSVTVRWSVDYNQAISIKYSLSLFLNDDNRVTSCSVTALHEKFFNCYRDLLNSQSQYDVMLELVMAQYILAYLHNGKEFDKDKLEDLVIDASKGILVNGREYRGKFFDCNFYAKLNEEIGITSMLDYGDNSHNG